MSSAVVVGLIGVVRGYVCLDEIRDGQTAASHKVVEKPLRMIGVEPSRLRRKPTWCDTRAPESVWSVRRNAVTLLQGQQGTDTYTAALRSPFGYGITTPLTWHWSC